MRTQPAPLPPPPVKRLEPILPPMTDATLMNKQKVMNIVYTQIQAIVNQARWVERKRKRKRFLFHLALYLRRNDDTFLSPP